MSLNCVYITHFNFVIQRVFLLNTIYNPLDDLIEALISLLSLFDLQETIENQLNITSESIDGTADETLISMATLLKKVIRNSCDYVSKPQGQLQINNCRDRLETCTVTCKLVYFVLVVLYALYC